MVRYLFDDAQQAERAATSVFGALTSGQFATVLRTTLNEQSDDTLKQYEIRLGWSADHAPLASFTYDASSTLPCIDFNPGTSRYKEGLVRLMDETTRNFGGQQLRSSDHPLGG